MSFYEVNAFISKLSNCLVKNMKNQEKKSHNKNSDYYSRMFRDYKLPEIIRLQIKNEDFHSKIRYLPLGKKKIYIYIFHLPADDCWQ